MFYFHGFPGSRLEAGFVEAPGIALVAADRPGYGLSSPRPGRTLADWPADVAALADHLGWRRFSILAVSAGVPYALACAHAMPERLRSINLVCGLGPPEAPGMDAPLMRRLISLGRNRLASIPLALLGQHLLKGRNARERFLAFRRRMIERTGAGVPKERAVATDALADHLYRSWHEGLRRSISGVVSDARIYASPWPFALGDVRCRARLWHGTEDRMVPVEVARFYARAIGGIEAQIEQGEGHFSIIFNSLPAILRAITEETRS